MWGWGRGRGGMHPRFTQQCWKASGEVIREWTDLSGYQKTSQIHPHTGISCKESPGNLPVLSSLFSVSFSLAHQVTKPVFGSKFLKPTFPEPFQVPQNTLSPFLVSVLPTERACTHIYTPSPTLTHRSTLLMRRLLFNTEQLSQIPS